MSSVSILLINFIRSARLVVVVVLVVVVLDRIFVLYISIAFSSLFFSFYIYTASQLASQSVQIYRFVIVVVTSSTCFFFFPLLPITIHLVVPISSNIWWWWWWWENACACNGDGEGEPECLWCVYFNYEFIWALNVSVFSCHFVCHISFLFLLA